MEEHEINETLTEAKNTKSGFYRVYVIKLRKKARNGRVTYYGEPNKPIVYVGQTGKSVQERFEEHQSGYKTNIQKYTIRLLPELYEQYNPLHTRTQAEKVEKALALKLNQEGYTILGGH